jgi:hypothetical protein
MENFLTPEFFGKCVPKNAEKLLQYHLLSVSPSLVFQPRLKHQDDPNLRRMVTPTRKVLSPGFANGLWMEVALSTQPAFLQQALGPVT